MLKYGNIYIFQLRVTGGEFLNMLESRNTLRYSCLSRKGGEYSFWVGYPWDICPDTLPSVMTSMPESVSLVAMYLTKLLPDN